jgi:hypothetical protein
MMQASGGGHPPKQENPHRGQTGRAFGESTFNETDTMNSTESSDFYPARQLITITSDHYATAQAVTNAAIEKGLTRSFEVRGGLNIFFRDYDETQLFPGNKRGLIELERLLGRSFEFRKQSGRVISLTDRALKLTCAELRERLQERVIDLRWLKQDIEQLAADGVVIDWCKGVTVTGTPTKTKGELARIQNANPEDVLAVLMGDEL